jgi:hypothetical protein
MPTIGGQDYDAPAPRTLIRELRARDRTAAWRRAEERDRLRAGTPLERRAVRMAEGGYGTDQISRDCGVSNRIARLIVTGIE